MLGDPHCLPELPLQYFLLSGAPWLTIASYLSGAMLNRSYLLVFQIASSPMLVSLVIFRVILLQLCSSPAQLVVACWSSGCSVSIELFHVLSGYSTIIHPWEFPCGASSTGPTTVETPLVEQLRPENSQSDYPQQDSLQLMTLKLEHYWLRHLQSEHPQLEHPRLDTLFRMLRSLLLKPLAQPILSLQHL